MIKTWNEEHDVLVIGSGFAGLSAAIEAREAGADVLVLEKMRAYGGNSIISDGGIAAPATQLQKKYSIDDSPNAMYHDMIKAGLGVNNPDLVRTLVEAANSTFEWSVNYLGVEYLDRVDIFGGHSVPRCYTAKNITGSTIIHKQIEKINELHIPIEYSSFVTGFVCDAAGNVCGLAVRKGYNYRDTSKGEDIYIKANRGVVIASGGFSSDIKFRTEHDPRLTDALESTNKPFATAEVLKQAIKTGAATEQLSCIQLGPWASPDERGYGVGPQFSEYIVFQYGIIIDPTTGHRFVNELADRKTLSDELLSIGHPCIGIADSKAVATSGWNIDSGIKKNVVRKFSTLNELAQFYLIPIETLANTISDFNQCVQQGLDIYFSKPLIDKAAPIENPPYYAIRLWPKVHFTMGGIKINVKSEVINTNGTRIKGLYAAGEVTGGIHGASRLGSASITDCLVFGRIAGQNAARCCKSTDELKGAEDLFSSSVVN